MAFKNNILVFIFCFIMSVLVVADQKPILFGHNLATTTQVLNKNQMTAGTYYLGVGITDNFTLGTSPWIVFGYNLENIILKYRNEISTTESLSHEVAYFKSNIKLGEKYEQTSMSYWLTFAHIFDQYTLNITMNYMYFWNEKRPFSLRREPFNNQAHQITLTSLHQFHFSERTILQFELGVLGINYAYPNLSAGASWAYLLNNKWSYQLGGSISKRFSGPYYPDYFDTSILQYENYAYDSIHPEIQIQYWF